MFNYRVIRKGVAPHGQIQTKISETGFRHWDKANIDHYDERMDDNERCNHDLGHRLINGDQTVFGDILVNYGPKVAGLLKKTFDWLTSEDIDDVLAEALASLWINRHRYDHTRASLKTYFYTIARSRAVDLTRKGWQKAKRLELDIDIDRSPHRQDKTISFEESLDLDASESSISHELVNMTRVLNELSQEDRVILLASTQEGCWAKDLQRQLGKPAVTIRSRRHRLVLRIREQMDQMIEKDQLDTLHE